MIRPTSSYPRKKQNNIETTSDAEEYNNTSQNEVKRLGSLKRAHLSSFNPTTQPHKSSIPEKIGMDERRSIGGKEDKEIQMGKIKRK